ncbi:MAG: hypothetical protein IJ081_00965 [Prevotella sp.]|jgi:hypothetical protein|nr:hypothetical protein [Prevotella sp.]
MKKLFILFLASLFAQNLKAQDVVYVDEEGNVLKDEVKHVDMTFAEAEPLMKSAKQIVTRAIYGKTISTSSELETGKNYYLLEVTQSEDTSLIGKPVVCQIIEKRKSNISGSEGRLRIRPLYIEKGNQQVPLKQHDIYRRGLNRSNVKAWTAFLLIPAFIPGSRAEIRPEEYIILTLDL